MLFATENRSVKVFDEFFETLVGTLEPADVTAGCFSKGIISFRKREEVEKLDRTQPSHQAIAVLLNAVRRSMISYPNNTFSAFLEVLSRERKYDQLVKDISKFIKEEDKY